MDRLMIMSSDCHWSPTSIEHYRQYLETRHHDALDAHLGAALERQASANQAMITRMEREPRRDDAASDVELRAAFSANPDREVRLKELEADGVVGEVLFPDGIVPFSTNFTMGVSAEDVELQVAGYRAYNRGLADFIDADRQVGLALVTYLDVDEAVREIHWAASAGLRGVLIGGEHPELPPLADEYYEPIWAACAEAGLPAHVHGGTGMPVTSNAPRSSFGGVPANVRGAGYSYSMEARFYSHRPLWLLTFGGVFERHPDFRLVFTEQGSDWVPSALAYMDYTWEHQRARWGPPEIPSPPSEYWRRQCWLGSSVLTAAEVRMRDDIGMDKMMFGNDFPHREGSWGRTPTYLQLVIDLGGGMSEEELRRLAGTTAVEVYGLDAAKLASIAERCGPRVDEVLRPPDEQPNAEDLYALLRPTAGF
jgi:predicted TIM-barrel fold metal-dependent hydrolase